MTPPDRGPRVGDDAAALGLFVGNRARAQTWAYAGAVALGAALILATAVTQPYNENEWAQIGPYGSRDPSVVVSGTRQPPLDPLLGSAFWHLAGEGQLRQRLPPAAFGIGSLVLLAALLRRLRTGWVGVAAAFWLATSPLFVRYSAYIRPYALPVVLMVLCAWAGTSWLASGRRRWLALAATGAFLLPLARVPEPVVFLATAAVGLGVRGLRRPAGRRRAWSLAGALVAGLLVSGVPMVLMLRANTSQSAFDPEPAHVRDRLGEGLHELLTAWVPLVGQWFPWWPATLAVVVGAAAMPEARALLRSQWWWLPSLAAPLVFALAFHLVNPMPFDVLPYRARFLYFLIPPVLLVVVAFGHAVARRWSRGRLGGPGRREHQGGWVGAALVGALIASQLPSTWLVVTRKDTVDFAEAGRVVRAVVPEDGVVLYDAPAPGLTWRQPFSGRDRYLTGTQDVVSVVGLARAQTRVSGVGPVYLLILDPPCASSIVCDKPAAAWSGQVPGYELVRRFDRFRLLAPTAGQAGPAGAASALAALAATYAAANRETTWLAQGRLLFLLGRPDQARAALDRACAGPADQREACTVLARAITPARYAGD